MLRDPEMSCLDRHYQCSDSGKGLEIMVSILTWKRRQLPEKDCKGLCLTELKLMNRTCLKTLLYANVGGDSALLLSHEPHGPVSLLTFSHGGQEYKESKELDGLFHPQLRWLF